FGARWCVRMCAQRRRGNRGRRYVRDLAENSRKFSRAGRPDFEAPDTLELYPHQTGIFSTLCEFFHNVVDCSDLAVIRVCRKYRVLPICIAYIAWWRYCFFELVPTI